MTKKSYTIITLFLSLILLLSISFFLGDFRYSKESFSSLCISDEDFNNIISTRSESNTPLLKELVFDSNPIFFDEEDNHFYYSLLEGSNTAYNPSIEWNSLRYNLAIKKTIITPSSIHNNETIELLIYNNNTYSKAKLTCTTLPLMNIDVNVALEDIKDTYQDMDMYLFDNKKNNTTDIKGEIHTRGSHVMYFPKKSFKIKLKDDKDDIFDNVNILSFNNKNEFILYPGYNDQERIRNVFSTNLWYESCAKNNNFGLDAGQYYQYFELFINNKYWGLYAITYPIDEKVLELDNTNKIENLYKKINGSANEYILYDKSAFEYGYDLKTNRDDSNVWYPLEHYYSVLFNSNSIKEIYEICDIQNSIDIFLFYNLIQGIDNVSIWRNDDSMLHNTFMYTKQYNDNYKMLYAPWDMDRTWGNGQDHEPYSIEVTYNSVMKLNPIFYLLELNDIGIKELIKERYQYLRENEWSNDNLLTSLNMLEKKIFNSGAYTRDIAKWKESDRIDPSIKLSNFKDYVIDRLSYMDEYIDDFVKDDVDDFQ